MGLFWGIFGPQNVRAVLNRAIFNHWVSNLDCAHDLRYLHLQNRKHQLWAICAAFGVIPLFRVNFFPQFSFYLNSFLPKFFFYPIFFYPNFFFTQIFFFKFFLGHFFFFDQIFSSIFSIFFHI